MTERSIFLTYYLAAVHLNESTCLLVAGLGEYIIGAYKEHLLAHIFQYPGDKVRSLLVGHISYIDNVGVDFLALGVCGIDKK